MNIEKIETFIGKVPNYPKQGILFYDISPMIFNENAFSSSVKLLCNQIK